MENLRLKNEYSKNAILNDLNTKQSKMEKEYSNWLEERNKFNIEIKNQQKIQEEIQSTKLNKKNNERSILNNAYESQIEIKKRLAENVLKNDIQAEIDYKKHMQEMEDKRISQ